jgi:hypothetical protein
MKKYQLTTSYLFFYILISLIIFVPVVILVYLFRNVMFLNLFFCLYLFVGIGRLLYWIWNESIVISEEGIVYKTSGITIGIPWNHIEEVRKVFIFVFCSRQDCLIADQSQVKIISTLLPGTFLLPINAGLNLQKAIIPLLHFSKNWYESDLGQQIKQYAPHLIEKGKSSSSA